MSADGNPRPTTLIDEEKAYLKVFMQQQMKKMTRDDALERIAKPAYDPETVAQDFEYIATKLGISVAELRGYHEMPLKTYRDYKNREWMFDLGAKALKLLGVERSIKR